MAEMYTLKSEEQSQQLKLIAGEELKDEQQLFQAVINKLISHGINAGDVKKLQDAGIYSCNDLMIKTKENLAGIKGLTEVKLHEICQAVEKIVTFGYITSSDALLRKSLETIGGGIRWMILVGHHLFLVMAMKMMRGVGGDEVAEDDEGAADDEEDGGGGEDGEEGEEDGGGGEEHSDLIPIFLRQEDGGLQFVGHMVRADCVGMDNFYDVSLHFDDIVAQLGIQLGEDFFNDFEIQLNQDALDEGLFPVPYNFADTLEAISRIVISQQVA